MGWLLGIAFLSYLAALALRIAFRAGRQIGKQEDYQLASDRAALLHQKKMTRLSIALTSMDFYTIGDAVKNGGADKVGALLDAFDKHLVKSELDAKARAAEWSEAK